MDYLILSNPCFNIDLEPTENLFSAQNQSENGKQNLIPVDLRRIKCQCVHMDKKTP